MNAVNVKIQACSTPSQNYAKKQKQKAGYLGI